jgi:translation initiation factor eIF-2B subunit gamma
MYATHRDAHIYIFPHWVMDFVQKNERLESIGEDVVGWWAKSGWQSGLAQKLHMEEICGQNTASEADGSQHGSDNSQRDASPDHGANSQEDLSASTVAVDAMGGQTSKASTKFEPPSMLAYVQPAATNQESEPLIRRVDNAALLLAISLQLAKLPSLEETGGEGASPFAHAKKVAYPEGVKSRTTITKQDSLIAENVTIEEKTSIKETVIGANCQINEGAKLSQCLLMEGVVVGKGCKLTRCILGKRCVIGANTTLTDCEVQENLLVEPQSKHHPLLFPFSCPNLWWDTWPITEVFSTSQKLTRFRSRGQG